LMASAALTYENMLVELHGGISTLGLRG
jgi:hypothetical protein